MKFLNCVNIASDVALSIFGTVFIVLIPETVREADTLYNGILSAIFMGSIGAILLYYGIGCLLNYADCTKEDDKLTDKEGGS